MFGLLKGEPTCQIGARMMVGGIVGGVTNPLPPPKAAKKIIIGTGVIKLVTPPLS